MAKNLHREFGGSGGGIGIGGGLEIGYEDSDSSWNFVRDGTVSWIHGMRYFERENNNSINFDERIRQLCRLKWALTYDSRD